MKQVSVVHFLMKMFYVGGCTLSGKAAVYIGECTLAGKTAVHSDRQGVHSLVKQMSPLGDVHL